MQQIEPFDAEWERQVKEIGRKLFAAYLLDGPARVAQMVLDGPDLITLAMPDEPEWRRRKATMLLALDEIAQANGWAA